MEGKLLLRVAETVRNGSERQDDEQQRMFGGLDR
jgi:hypothetical protein